MYIAVSISVYQRALGTHSGIPTPLLGAGGVRACALDWPYHDKLCQCRLNACIYRKHDLRTQGNNT